MTTVNKKAALRASLSLDVLEFFLAGNTVTVGPTKKVKIQRSHASGSRPRMAGGDVPILRISSTFSGN